MNELTSKLKIKLHIKSISTLIIWNNIKIPKIIEIVRYHPILTDITRSRPILPDITRSHPIPLDITRSHPISPDPARFHSILPEFFRTDPKFGFTKFRAKLHTLNILFISGIYLKITYICNMQYIIEFFDFIIIFIFYNFFVL